MLYRRSSQLPSFFWEAFIKTCGWSSSVIVIIIVLFLFKEGSALFGQKPLEKGLIAAVHIQNPISRLSQRQLEQLVQGKISNWKEIGGRDEKVEVLSLNNLEKKLKEWKLVSSAPEELLGGELEKLSSFLDSLLSQKPGLLIILQQKYIPQSAKPIELEDITLWHFLAGTEWEPAESPVPSFGVLPLLWGSLLVTIGATFFALLLGPPVAIYLAEIAPVKVKSIIKTMIELLAGIPSVVFGFIGLVVLVPSIQQWFNLDSGSTALAGSFLLAIIALPTIISVTEDAISDTPRALKEASLALGATHWQTIYRVVIPYSATGIIAAVLLGVGRIVGETMAVLMVTGNNPQLVGLDFLSSVRTMSAAIAAEMGEAPQGGLHYKSLFAVGCILFMLTFFINFLGELLKYFKKLQ
ncbi:MAG: phosphate ABC transporter permease subunit PstC [Bacteroidia bacterium]|nr:phosphate ABC transporter permease subunit PstC [Bacteroidia bacterium]MDW8157396.1 phosphate ABC transporter permease subunit PstC [Bacteroidia bacterium]